MTDTHEPPEIAIVATPPNTFVTEGWHMDDIVTHNAVIIPLSDIHDHTEFFADDKYKYRARRAGEQMLNYKKDVNWGVKSEKIIAEKSPEQLKRSDFVFFNTMRVHRGPANKTNSWRIVIFMTWPVGIDAAVEHRKRIANSKVKTDIVRSDSKVYMLKDYKKIS